MIVLFSGLLHVPLQTGFVLMNLVRLLDGECYIVLVVSEYNKFMP